MSPVHSLKSGATRLLAMAKAVPYKVAGYHSPLVLEHINAN